jgi:metal-responsive CopG/Arc/MetJ family transcriptional regulator
MTTPETIRKERFEFRISRELLAKVEARAEREGVSRAEIVTRAIESYLLAGPSENCTSLTDKIENLKTMLERGYKTEEPAP